MKKYLLVLLAAFPLLSGAQTARGVKIAYIDMEYILEKVPDYAEAKNQLEIKANKWKQEIELKKGDIAKLREGLKAEKALLTKELIEEREEEIQFLEKELMDFQEKRFGPKGDLISQKAVLVKPIQDQVFNVVQDISEQRKYDFVFDKSSDLTMLFAAQRHDISDLVVRRLTRSAKREQLSGKELKKLEEQEAQEDLQDDPDFQDRQKKIEDKKTERENKLAERKALQDEKRKQYEERRQRLLEERDAKRAGGTTGGTAPKATGTGNANNPASTDDTDTPPAPVSNTNRPSTTPTTSTTGGNNQRGSQSTVQGENAIQPKTTTNDTPEEGTAQSVNRQTAAQQAQEERARKAAERAKELEERKKRILAEREAAKKAREEQKQQNQNNGGTTTTDLNKEE